ncbi:MAG TPA: hypothetical protein VK101_03780 [Limnochordia bacterium]|nr:hypothetical protein [Limnochordia bacterium]
MAHANIDQRGIERRRRMGWASLILGALLGVWIIAQDMTGWPFLALFLLFLGAGLGISQARRRT